jgi:hypothetical protein
MTAARITYLRSIFMDLGSAIPSPVDDGCFPIDVNRAGGEKQTWILTSPIQPFWLSGIAAPNPTPAGRCGNFEAGQTSGRGASRQSISPAKRRPRQQGSSEPAWQTTKNDGLPHAWITPGKTPVSGKRQRAVATALESQSEMHRERDRVGFRPNDRAIKTYR